MKDIYNLLKDLDIEIPEEKKGDFEKGFFENYKTVAEFDKVNSKLANVNDAHKELQAKYDSDTSSRDKDLAELKKQLEAAGGDKGKIEELTNNFKELQSKYKDSKKDYEAKLANQRYEYAVREEANKQKFSSNSAKRVFIQDALEKKLTMGEDGNVLGFDDFVNEYKQKDANAFLQEEEKPAEPKQPKPSFSSSTNKVDEGNKETSNEDKTGVVDGSVKIGKYDFL